MVCALRHDDIGALRSIGVRDSKKLTRKRRVELAEEIRGNASVSIASIDAESIDSRRRDVSLNEIEVELFSRALMSLDVSGQRIIADSCDVDCARFSSRLSGLVGAGVEAYHRADDTYPVVSAASIFAKVERDRAMDEINESAMEEYGMVAGSGYPSDPKTREFLGMLGKKRDGFPRYVRTSWKTVKDLGQSTLDAYDK